MDRLEDLRGRLVGGERGELGLGLGFWLGSRRFWKDCIAWEMEWDRERGREEERSEEGLMPWIRVLREGFEDFRACFAADLRNSSVED